MLYVEAYMTLYGDGATQKSCGIFRESGVMALQGVITVCPEEPEEEDVQLLIAPPASPSHPVSPASPQGTSTAPVTAHQGLPAGLSTPSSPTSPDSPGVPSPGPADVGGSNLAVEGTVGDGAFSPVVSRLQSGAQPVVQAPLRQAVGPEGEPVFVHVPFSTADLINWKQSVGQYRQNPEAMAQLFSTIFLTHQPNWIDIQALLAALLTPEEKRLVLEKARTIAQQCHPAGDVDELCPKKNKDWDPNTRGGRKELELYQEFVLAALRQAIPKQKNLSKLYEVRQGPEEDPSSFYGRLCEAARQWMDLDPELPENARMFNTLFIGQSAPDIRKKLQKAEGAAGMSISQMIEIAYKVYSNRDQVKEKKKDKRMKAQASLQASLLAAAIVDQRSRGRGRGVEGVEEA
ncbi:uncharacterized protein LOC132249856 [Alligator mississippiensis]|uniref:uncharacterized protein LOC132249856 n=1 Tax=Alligator mississippiensis TaxID=8496 RepID=UPI00287741AE|nr:uncharacterized protein LOC132249856 [Alligator mississippiensis]XP_059581508.1 uncharacterized protein LOC132249856 [Alligator mississippiensis]